MLREAEVALAQGQCGGQACRMLGVSKACSYVFGSSVYMDGCARRATP